MTKGRNSRLLSLVLVLALAVGMTPVGVFASGQSVQSEYASAGAGYESGEVLVVFDEGVSNASINSVLGKNDLDLEKVTKSGDEKIALGTTTGGQTVEEAVAEVDKEKKVLFSQPNFVYKIQATDPYLANKTAKRYQYHLDMIKAREAWKEVESAKKQKTKVAVLDTGVDINHEDLKANVKSYKRSVAGKIVAGDADTGSHGSHVTGIIGATYGNGKGGAGVASGTKNDLCDIMVVANSEDGATMTTYNLVTAMNYAVKNGAKVINMSYGGDVRDRINASIIKQAYYDKGVVFVGASGNDDWDGYSDPSDIKEVISVCNVNSDGYRESFTNYGWAKDISAPGTNIVSTIPNDFYAKMTGTSMAAPVVAGVCALMLDVNPSLTPAQVRNIICATAVKKPAGGSDNYYENNELGYGLVDALAAVKAAKAAPTTKVDSIEIKKDKAMPIVMVSVENTDRALYGGDVKYYDEGVGLETLVMPANSGAGLTWTSDDPSIATVDAKGIVRGKKPGSTTIRVSAGGKTDSCEVQVLQSVDPTSISIDLEKKDRTMYLGESSSRLGEALNIEPFRTVTNREVYWQSSDWSVLTVDDQGYMTARKVGKATVTARTYNGKIAKTEIEVIEPPAKVKITKSTNWLRMGEKGKFAAQVQNASGKKMSGYKIRWESGNKTLASVDSNGNVKTKKPGNLYIFATLTWGSEEVNEIVAYKKLTITKKNYKGKKDYGLKVKKQTKKAITLTWKKIPKTNGYEVLRATAKNGNKKGKYKVIKKLNAKKAAFTDKKVKKGKTYYYKVRAKFKKNGKAGKYGYSNIVKAKAKTVKAKKK